MDTLRVNIAYRPLRICWAIRAGDFAAFREAVQTNHALWGGRFNPIVVVDQLEEARAIVECFRADIIFPIGESAEVKAFAESYGHLISPFFRDGVFVGKGNEARSRVLDIQNAIISRNESPEWKHLKELKPRIYRWDVADPLSDVFLMHFGAYPARQDIEIDYESMFKNALDAEDVSIGLGSTLNDAHFDHPSIAYLSRHGLMQHYSVRSHWNWPGFFIGHAANLDDLVTFWNLRACDVSVLFVDLGQIDRYKETVPSWKKHTATILSHLRFQDDHQYAIWSRREAGQNEAEMKAMLALIGDERCMMCGIGPLTWGPNNLAAPLMYFGQSASLGVLGDQENKPKLSFGLTDRPYATDVWFHSQHLVASIDFIGGLYGRDDFTLDPPYIPELNEFYSRAMHFRPRRLRIESERIGLVIDAHDTDSFIYALPTADLFKRVFQEAGFDASVSSGGLIARQLIAQLGGVQGGRVFKVPGARRLLKTYGPHASFTKHAALQIIGKRDEDNRDSKFSDHADLYLETREQGKKLTPADVFAYLVNNKLFRLGADLLCPSCQLQSWLPVDDVRQHVTCQMCGESFSTTPQLINSDWAFRRSGLLGTERNVQGAVPVVLTLQQLDANLGLHADRKAHSVSLDLKPKNNQMERPCEVDFALIIPQPYQERTLIIIGECKDRGQGRSGDGSTINATDIGNLRIVADSFPKKRFEVFILLAKLCDFTAEEVELAKSLNGEYQCRVIMLTDRELEPYNLYDRTEKLFKIDDDGSTPASLARSTVNIFLDPKPIDPS